MSAKRKQSNARLRTAINERKEWAEINGNPDIADNEAIEDLMADCGMDRSGSCSKAGSEECDFECPFS